MMLFHLGGGTCALGAACGKLCLAVLAQHLRLYDCGAATVRLYRTLFLTPFRFFRTALLAAFLTHIGVRLAVLFCLVFYHVDKIPRRNAEKEKHKYNKKRYKDYKRAGKAEG